MSELISMLFGAGLGVAGTYLMTHPDKRGALFSRVGSLAKQEYAWLKPAVAKLFHKG